MRVRITEKNGFLKPLGLLLIILILSLTCFINLVFAGGLSSSEQDYLSEKEIENRLAPDAFDGLTTFPYMIPIYKD